MTSLSTSNDAALPTSMRAAAIDGAGGPEVLTVRTLPLPEQVSAEFLVRVVAAGVNPIDAKTRAGSGVFAGIAAFPFVLGNDFSGVVVKSPYDAHPIKVGDEVYGMMTVPRGSGSYAEYVSVPALQLARKPLGISHIQAAGVPIAALTAWGAVVQVGKVHDGQKVLIHAGAGGVGHLAVQLARYFGAYVTATGSAANLAWLEELGAHRVIDYRASRFEDSVSDQDLVIDLVGNVHADTGTRSLGVLRRGGLLVNVPSGSWPNLLADAAAAGVRATGYKVSADGAALAVISRLIESGDLNVTIERTFPLEDIAAAHILLEAGHVRGKLVITLD